MSTLSPPSFPQSLTHSNEQYTSKTDFLARTIAHLGDRVLTAPLRIQPLHVHLSVTDSDSNSISNVTAVVEMRAIDAKCRNGTIYDMTYCWVCEFAAEKEGDAEGVERIVRVRAYLDSELLMRALQGVQ